MKDWVINNNLINYYRNGLQDEREQVIISDSSIKKIYNWKNINLSKIFKSNTKEMPLRFTNMKDIIKALKKSENNIEKITYEKGVLLFPYSNHYFLAHLHLEMDGQFLGLIDILKNDKNLRIFIPHNDLINRFRKDKNKYTEFIKNVLKLPNEILFFSYNENIIVKLLYTYLNKKNGNDYISLFSYQPNLSNKLLGDYISIEPTKYRFVIYEDRNFTKNARAIPPENAKAHIDFLKKYSKNNHLKFILWDTNKSIEEQYYFLKNSAIIIAPRGSIMFNFIACKNCKILLFNSEDDCFSLINMKRFLLIDSLVVYCHYRENQNRYINPQLIKDFCELDKKIFDSKYKVINHRQYFQNKS